ncbi:hypothetical protein [Thiohalocapsa halophila]|uniref:hypothetical protein n=1 Tax=Thiohalocapsa halophila TaxID=69359 RepID=UPI0019071AC8|nr:hypothetical protein [Thiohalocapsa halophila]
MKYILTGILLFSASSTTLVYQVQGAGTISCGRYIEEKRNSPRLEHLANMHWVQGFVTGVNYAESNNLGAGIDMNAMAQYLENYCLKNPLNDLADASTELVRALRKR